MAESANEHDTRSSANEPHDPNEPAELTGAAAYSEDGQHYVKFTTGSVTYEFEVAREDIARGFEHLSECLLENMEEAA